MNEEKDRVRTGPFLRAGALILALVLLWQLVVPSMTNRANAQAETQPTEDPALLASDGSRPDSAQGYSDLADQSIAQEDYETALIRLEAARELLTAQGDALSPEDKALLQQLWLKTATVAILSGDIAGGSQALDEALALDPKDTQALLLRAQLNVESGAFQEAVADVKTYLEENPEDGDTRRTLAQLLEQMGDYDGAMEQYEALYRIFPEDESANLNALRCLFLLGRYQEAVEGFDDYISRLPEDEPDPYGGVAHFLRAASLLQLGQTGDAAAGFEVAMEAGYDRAACLEQLTLCFFETGEYEKVLQAGSELETMEDGTIASPALLYQRLGVAALYLEDHRLALDYLEKAEQTGQTPEGNAYYRGVCLLSLGQTQEAAEAFTQSIADGQLLQLSYYNRGVCYVSLERYEDALADMKRTLESGDDPELLAAAEDMQNQITQYLALLQAAQATEETAE